MSTAHDPAKALQTWVGSLRGEPAAAASLTDALHFLEFDAADLDRLGAIRVRLEPELAAVVRRYYDHLARFQAPAAALAAVERADYESNLTRYLEEILAGDFSEAHVAHRVALGLAHGRDGLPHVWFTASYRLIERLLGEVLRASAASTEAYLEDRRTLGKVLTYDMGLVMTAHVREFVSVLADQNKLLADKNAALHAERGLRAQLVQMLVHDMAGPLNTLTTAAQVITDTVGVDPAVGWFMEVMQRNHRRMRNMLMDALDVYRSEEHDLDLQYEHIAVDDVAEEVLAEYDLGDAEGPTYRLEAVGQSVMRADPGLLARVLRNLLDNATKYTPDDGTITVRIDSEPGEECVRVTVEDTGQGVPRGDRERIFNRFFTNPQSDDARVRSRRRGIGLGLAFCKLAIERHGGQITVQTPAIGHGAAFTFTLPKNAPSA